MMKSFCHKLRWAALVMALVVLFTGSAMAAYYKTLEFGSRGTEVRKLQEALLALGYDPNGTDGKFGRGTENAVKQYQAANGLEPDGKAGHLTLTKLYHGTSVPAGGAGNTGSSGSSGNSGNSGSSGNTGSTGNGFPEPGTYSSSNPNTLHFGDSGSRVRELQTWLNKLGYNTNGIDGQFGRGTHMAVCQFQKDNGLTPDGLAGQQTLKLIEQKAAQAGSSSGSTGNTGNTGNSGSTNNSGNDGTPAVGVPAGLNRTLRKGSTGEDVRIVQKQLKALGYYTSSVDGVYGNGSIAAVRAFQQNNGLTADGLAGQKTFQKLFSASAVPAGGSTGSNGNSGNTGDSGSAGDNGSTGSNGSSDSGSSSTYTTLQYGSKGEAVRRLQQALKDLKYNVGVDGDYGALTRMAVTSFQKRNGLKADGVAGPDTQELLYSGNALEADPDENAGSDLPPGTGSASGPSTSSVQLLHWFNDIKPTIRTGQTVTVFDPATNLQWTLRFYSLGRHADSEPLTLTDTQIMFKAFGNKNTWTPKPVYVQLPSGVWTLATMHNVPHLSGSISDNGFDGHLCVHFLRDMDECSKNDPKYGVQNQQAIRKKWKEMTGITVN